MHVVRVPQGQRKQARLPLQGSVGYQHINTCNQTGVIIKVVASVESVALNTTTTLEPSTSKDRGESLRDSTIIHAATSRCGTYIKLSLVAGDDIEWKMRTPPSLLVIPGRGTTRLPRVTTGAVQYGDTRGELL